MKPIEQHIAATMGAATPQRGGRRKGAGRKRVSDRERVAHRPRPAHDKDTPVLVTLRAHESTPPLRTPRIAQFVRTTIDHQQIRGYAAEFQIVELAIHDAELQLIVEASSERALRSGVSGFMIGFARRLNKQLGRTGHVWGDRWHGRPLASPKEVREALATMFRDAARHDPRLGAPGTWPENRPRTWLLEAGWLAHAPPVK